MRGRSSAAGRQREYGNLRYGVIALEWLGAGPKLDLKLKRHVQVRAVQSETTHFFPKRRPTYTEKL